MRPQTNPAPPPSPVQNLNTTAEEVFIQQTLLGLVGKNVIISSKNICANGKLRKGAFSNNSFGIAASYFTSHIGVWIRPADVHYIETTEGQVPKIVLV